MGRRVSHNSQYGADRKKEKSSESDTLNVLNDFKYQPIKIRRIVCLRLITELEMLSSEQKWGF
jgi:hypothetical protein